MMSKPVAKILFILMMIGAFVFTAIGGYMDMTDQKRWGMMSKEHLWNDGLFMLTAAALLLYVVYE
jgi:hypothetical protein